MTEQVGPIPNRVHHSGNVLEFALESIALGLTTLATTTPVNSINRKLFLKCRKNGCPARVSAACAMYQHEGRPCSASLVGDRGAIFRWYFFHNVFLRIPGLALATGDSTFPFILQ